MPDISLSHSLEASIDFKLYSEELEYPSEGKPIPTSRSQKLIYRPNSSQWWIKVTYQGDIYTILNQPVVRSKRERRAEFQDFVKLIDYTSVFLLEDTVTELVLLPSGEGLSLPTVSISEEARNNTFAGIAAKLTYTTREDPLRIIYPLYDEFPSFQPIHTDQLLDHEEIADGIFRVLKKSNGMPYVLKMVKRPLYNTHDTESIRKELENIEIFRDTPNIIHASGVAVSINPYTTSHTGKQVLVIKGIVLEYHSAGDLKTILDANPTCLQDYPWKEWPLQIATALSHFHAANKTHMDIKPSNIVIDTNGTTILLDISGIGGFTHEWLAPEIRNDMACLSSDMPFEVRRGNDIWAFGRLLGQVILHVEDCIFVEELEKIAGGLMVEDVQQRMSLAEAISRLSILADLEGTMR
ncbi:protein kinase [Aspergillus stella-maris]|uniref:protein kinase n=1 Tax=Aspergillus stella-maris TaxID=1810926 RepID=UPI003CCDD6F7